MRDWHNKFVDMNRRRQKRKKKTSKERCHGNPKYSEPLVKEGVGECYRISQTSGGYVHLMVNLHFISYLVILFYFLFETGSCVAQDGLTFTV